MTNNFLPLVSISLLNLIFMYLKKNNFINPFMLHIHLFKQKLYLYKTNNLVKAICCGFSNSVSHFLFTQTFIWKLLVLI